jgi:hypothetical protein
MNQNVLIQKANGKKVCDIEKHYELPINEFSSVLPINKTVNNVASMMIKEDVALINQKE